jgi:pyruvate,orthophosphate dikinase
VGLGGRVEPAALARRAGTDESTAQGLLADAEQRQLVQSKREMYWLTVPGREELQRLLHEERTSFDSRQAAELYARFCAVNDVFKSFVTELQLSELAPASAIDRLREIDGSVSPIVTEAVQMAPRLSPFPIRFGEALNAVADGDGRYVSHPLVDSYHSIWFELHEELIHLAGLSRADEAAQGRA